MASTNGLIDVKALIAARSSAEHAALADAYFAAVPDEVALLRKPFFGIPDTQANLHGIADMLQRLWLFQGARVCDFGAGTGWLSRVLACLGCQPVAVDVSARALAMGRRAFEGDASVAGLSIDWRVYDGVSLPLADASMDRIACYDAFHHVPDQAAMLREFYRVLVPGGRIAFQEPGPHHSASPVSQYEMRHHGVIENDMVIEEIWALAEAAGFRGLELALPTPRTPSVTLDAYSRIIRGEATMQDATAILGSIVAGADNLRIFAMAKGEPVLDSRTTAGLAGTATVRLTQTEGATLRGHARVVNTGSAVWRPSLEPVGGVRLGVTQPDVTGAVDYGRIWLSDSPIVPGQVVEVDFALPAPPHRPVRLGFDLLAEHVIWFETLGGAPVFVLLD